MERKIPKVIHMTNKTKEFPENIINMWKKLNPDYTFTFSDDKDCYDFIENNFNKEYAELFNKIFLSYLVLSFTRILFI